MEEGKKEKKDDCPWSGRAFPLVMERALHAMYDAARGLRHEKLLLKA